MKNRYPPFQFNVIFWRQEIGRDILEEEGWSLYPNFTKQIFASKLRFFQYRILTCNLMTNVRRKKWNQELPDTCSFCGKEKETVIHLLLHCEKIGPLWRSLSKWIEYFLKVKITGGPELVLLNNYVGKQGKLINTLVIILKQYIYASKCLEEKPTFMGFLDRITRWHNIEKLMAIESNCFKAYKSKWQPYVNM